MKKLKKGDIGGNNFLLSVGFVILILGLFVSINTNIKELIDLKQLLGFELNNLYSGGILLTGCVFIIWAFAKD